jgi:5'-nucleotidase
MALLIKKMYQETIFNDPLEMTQEMVRILKTEQLCDIICLSHLGYSYKMNLIKFVTYN